MTALTPELVVATFGLAAGVGITAVGPGGVLVIVGLALVPGLSPAEIAGTAITTQLATGAAGSIAYYRSGQLRDPATRRLARLLAIPAVVGTPVGVLINSLTPGQVFNVLLSLLLVLTAWLVWFRSAHRTDAPSSTLRPGLLLGVGAGVSTAAGIFGIGGPLLTVPLLVVLGAPVLSALGAAQVQSVVVAGVGTSTYLAQCTVDWRLVLIAGLPQLCGVLLGWRIALVVAPPTLRRAMVVALLASAVLVGIT